jgi:hypothetical protein
MAGRRLSAADVPTPGPWLVHGEAEPGASAVALMHGVPPAANDGPGGWPYFVRRNVPVEPDGSHLHIASGTQRLADAKLIAAAPAFAAALLRLLTTPDLMQAELDARTQEAMAAAWDLLVRVAPHLEIGP